MAKKTRKELVMTVATTAENTQEGPKINAPMAGNFLVDALLNAETLGAVLGVLACALLVANNEATRTIPVAGSA